MIARLVSQPSEDFRHLDGQPEEHRRALVRICHLMLVAREGDVGLAEDLRGRLLREPITMAQSQDLFAQQQALVLVSVLAISQSLQVFVVLLGTDGLFAAVVAYGSQQLDAHRLTSRLELAGRG